MRVPHLVNGLPPFIASTDFRRSASDHIFFSQLSLIALTPVVGGVPRFAHRMPPSASQDLPFPVLPDVFLFFTRVIQAQSPRQMRALHNTDTITANALLCAALCCGVF
jgi:hypothetical protein